ncbi:MAG: aminotransferase class V-fold PLP-dependent enzyme [Syntrophobacteraceae bacterium]
MTDEHKQMRSQIIYLDNAATSYPKPPSTMERMVAAYVQMGVSPGRGGYDLAVEADALVNEVRRKLSCFFGSPDADRVIFTCNATDALNLVLQGCVNPGDHIVSTRLEHNSVLRPLHHMREQGIVEYDLVPFDGKGFVDPDDVAKMIRTDTKAVVVSHASNVLGTVQPIEDIGWVCAERAVPLIVDAAQSAGVIPIDMTEWQVSAVAFTGHKSLMGPSGIGGLVLKPGLDVRTTRFGGTGIDSESPIHTQTFPHRLEAGTLNLLGIIGLSEGLEYVMSEGQEAIHSREMELLTRLRDGLSELDGIKLYCADNLSRHVALLTANVCGISSQDVGTILDADFGIAVRAGLHCAPLVHADICTGRDGGVRFSLGPFTTQSDIDAAIEAMATITEAQKKQ